MRLATGQGCDALREIKKNCRRSALLMQHGLDDFRGFRLGEPALAQESVAILIAAGDDPLARGLDAGDERRRRGVGEARQGRGGLVGEALRGELGMPDSDLLEILAPHKLRFMQTARR